MKLWDQILKYCDLHQAFLSSIILFILGIQCLQFETCTFTVFAASEAMWMQCDVHTRLNNLVQEEHMVLGISSLD